MRLVARFGVAIVLVSVGLAGAAAPSLAECVSQPNRFPRFTDVAPTAETVVIGTVVESKSEDPTEATVLFGLRVDHVLRGDPPATMEIEGLRSGLPVRGAEGCRENAFLYVRVGDVIALALDGQLDGRTGVNTAAWIEGRPDRILMPSGQVLSRSRAVAAAEAMPPTDAAPTGSQLDPTDLISLAVRSIAAAWDGLLSASR